MDSPSVKNSRSSREEKRRKQREALGVAFADPLVQFSDSPQRELRNFSEELAEEAEKFKERIRKVSASSQELVGGFSPTKAKAFVDERALITEDLDLHLKACRSKVRDAQEKSLLSRPTAKRLLSGIEEFDAVLLKERAALARNRVKIEYGILSHPTHARIGEAYLVSLVDSLPEPAGARIQKQGKREKHDQDTFKTMVRNAYSPRKESANYDGPVTDLLALWCPVTRKWHESKHVVAAHIVPYAIGELNASYIFGLPICQGWNAIWDFRNGLLLHERVEKAMDDGQLLIVPDPEAGQEFKVVVLATELMKHSIYMDGPKFGDIHDTRFLVDGLENDQEKLKMGRLWGTPGKWMGGSIIRALALEVGGILIPEEDVEMVSPVPSCPRVSPDKEKQIAIDIRQVFERVGTDEDGNSDDE